MKDKYYLFLILSSVFILLTFISYFDPLVLWDANAYLSNSKYHLMKANYIEDFRPPLIEYIIAGLWSITGESIFLARVILIFFYLLTIYFFFLLTKIYFKKNILLTFLFSFSSIIIYWSFRVYTDILVVFFILLSIYLFNKKNTFLSGFISSFAFLTKPTAILLVISIIFYLILEKKIKDLFLYLSAFILGLLPWIMFNFYHYNNLFWDFINYYEIVNKYNHFIPPINFIKDLLIFTNIFLIMILIKIKKLIKTKELRLFIMYSLIYFTYISFISKVKFDRFVPSILPFIYLLGWYGILEIKELYMKRIIVYLSIFLTLFLLISTLININKEFYCNRNGSIIKTINYLKNEKDINIISNVWPWFGYYNNFYVHSLYTNLNELILKYNPKYIIYNKGIGELFINEDEFKNFKLKNVFYGSCSDITYIYEV